VDLNSRLVEYEERMSALETEGRDMVRRLLDQPEVKELLLNPDGFDDFLSVLLKSVEQGGYIEDVLEMSRSLVAKNKSGTP
jgi:hypothetical protein